MFGRFTLKCSGARDAMADLFGDLPSTRDESRDTETEGSFAQHAVAAAQQNQQQQEEQQQQQRRREDSSSKNAQAQQSNSRVAGTPPPALRKRHVVSHQQQMQQLQSTMPASAPAPPAKAQNTSDHSAQSSTHKASSLVQSSVTDEYTPSKPNEFNEVAQQLCKELGFGGAHDKQYDDDAGEYQEHERDGEGERELDQGGSELQSNVIPSQSEGSSTSVEQLQQAESEERVESRKRKGLSAAQTMMESMGWRVGEGLGKDLQGIVEPLAVRKHGKRTGVIEESNSGEKAKEHNQSRVVLLTNTVGRGEVDDELEEEVAQECERFGKVVRCTIFEVARTVKVPDHEAVRVFVEFESAGSARSCARGMHGRHFAGREVSAALFDESCYFNNELAPQLGSL